MHDVDRVISDEAFWVALVVAAAGVLLIWARARDGHHEPGVMVVIAVASLVGLSAADLLHASLVVGAALLLLGDWATRDDGVPAQMIGAVPGALVLGAALPDGVPFWIRAVVVVASTITGGVLTDRADRTAPRLAPALLAIGAVGLYFCVPDTEAPQVVLGALLAGALVGVVPRLVPALGSSMVAGLFVWAAGLGGVGRAGSVVGGIACLGLVLLLPLLRWRQVAGVQMVAAVLVQGALVVFVSRVAGFEDSAWSALALCIPAFAVAAGVLLVLRGRRATAN